MSGQGPQQHLLQPCACMSVSMCRGQCVCSEWVAGLCLHMWKGLHACVHVTELSNNAVPCL